MSRARLLLAGAPLVALPLAGAGMLAAEILYAVRRRLPRFADLDASGTFGDPGLPPLRIVAMGDSSVTGVGLDDPAAIWVQEVARHFGDRFHVELHSLAVGGSKAGDVLIHQLPRALELQPDLALISVGANDALRATPLWRLRRELEAILLRLNQAGTAVAFLGIGDLGSIPRLVRPLNSMASVRARMVDALQAEVVARHVGAAKADAWGADTTRAFRSRPELFSPDLFHASAAGHLLWAAIAVPAAEAALSSRTA